MANLLATLFGWLGGARAQPAAGAVADAAATETADTTDAAAVDAAASTKIDAQSIAGWYGKIPALGDFASRRLPDTFTTQWDTWLADGMQAGAAANESGWPDAFRAAPLWHFVLTPGVIDEHAWYGVLLPSADRVGRQFPLTVALAGTSAGMAPAVLLTWFEGAAQAARDALADGASADALDETLTKLGAPPAAPDAEDGLLARIGAANVEEALGQAAALLLPGVRGISLWWPHGDSPVVRVLRGLPPAFGKLVDGSL